MRLELYQAETEQIAKEQGFILDEVCQRLREGKTLSRLERNGVLHTFQVLIENSIGKAKQILKSHGEVVPVSAYDAFTALRRENEIAEEELPQWDSIVGLRNRIVHEYMNVDVNQVLTLVKEKHYQFIVAFLLKPIADKS